MTCTPADSVLLSYVCIIIIVTICYMDFFKHFFVADPFRVGLYCILHVGKATFEYIYYCMNFSFRFPVRVYSCSYRGASAIVSAPNVWNSEGRMVQTIGNTQCI